MSEIPPDIKALLESVRTPSPTPSDEVQERSHAQFQSRIRARAKQARVRRSVASITVVVAMVAVLAITFARGYRHGSSPAPPLVQESIPTAVAVPVQAQDCVTPKDPNGVGFALTFSPSQSERGTICPASPGVLTAQLCPAVLPFVQDAGPADGGATRGDSWLAIKANGHIAAMIYHSPDYLSGGGALAIGFAPSTFVQASETQRSGEMVFGAEGLVELFPQGTAVSYLTQLFAVREQSGGRYTMEVPGFDTVRRIQPGSVIATTRFLADGVDEPGIFYVQQVRPTSAIAHHAGREDATIEGMLLRCNESRAEGRFALLGFVAPATVPLPSLNPSLHTIVDMFRATGLRDREAMVNALRTCRAVHRDADSEVNTIYDRVERELQTAL